VLALAFWVPAGRGLAAHHRRVDAAADAARGAGSAATDAEDDRGAHAAQRRLVVLLTLAFAGQASGYYAMTAWLPSILGDTVGLAPAAAGGGAAPFQLAAIAGAFLVPIALAGRVPARAVAASLSALWIALPVGLLVAPDLWWLWVCLAGAAQGGSFTVILTLLAQRSPSVAAARRGSAVVQTAGYACAAAAPTALGAIHESTAGWTAPLLVILALLVVMAVALWTASRPTYLDR
jgi:CP family cyanate transporter-like MFS transporter